MGLRTRGSIFVLTLIMAVGARGQEVEGVHVPNTVELNDTPLTLNGVGVRRHFLFNVYVAALYLTQAADTPEAAINVPVPKRIRLHLLRDVSAEDMMQESLERFRANASEAAYRKLHDRIEAFHGAFPDLRAGDVVHVDLVPEGTEIWINDWLLAEIPGRDFQAAVLRLWLGDHPADTRLKQAMLGRQ